MDTPSGDHIAAVAADIDAFAKATGGVTHTSALTPKITVASLASLDCDRLLKAAVFRLQLLQALLADVAIDINYKDAGRPPGCDADVRVRPSFPPVFDSLAISGGVLDTIGGARMFAGMIARSTGHTFTPSVVNSVQRQHVPAATSVAEGKFPL